MSFLVWYNPATWLSDAGDGIAGAIITGLRTLFYNISNILYKFIITLYELFSIMCRTRLLDNTTLEELTSRIGLLLGIIMLFYVSFSFIKMLIDPDSLTDKSKGAVSIIKKVLIVIVLLGTSTFIFDTLHNIQVAVINSNVISKLLLPYEIKEENFGPALSAELFTATYNVDYDFVKYIDTDQDPDDAIKACQYEIFALRKQIYENGNFHLGINCLNETITIDEPNISGGKMEYYIMDFNYLISLVVGVFTIYFLVSYCISVGIRTIQLALLEIISPMAFISYLAPKQDTMFSKWTKIYVATYIDVFIRIAIINFIVFLIATILSGDYTGAFWESVGNITDTTNFTKSIIEITMIIALLFFAKRAPELIKDLFPAGASKLGLGGLHMKDMLGGKAMSGFVKKAPGKVLGTAIGAGAGVVGGAIGGGAVGAALGLFRGGAKGFSGKGLITSGKSGYSSSKSLALRGQQRRLEGGSTNPFQRIGSERRVNEANINKENLESQNKILSQVSSNFKTIKDRIKGKLDDGSYNNNANMQMHHAAKNKADALRKQLSKLKEPDYINASKKQAIKKLQAAGVDLTLPGSDKYIEAHQKAIELKMRQDYQQQFDNMNMKITQLETEATTHYDNAMKDFYRENKDDAVIANAIRLTEDIRTNNPNIDGLASISMNDFDSFKAADGFANENITNNNIKIAEIERDSKVDRINVKYSNKK